MAAQCVSGQPLMVREIRDRKETTRLSFTLGRKAPIDPCTTEMSVLGSVSPKQDCPVSAEYERSASIRPFGAFTERLAHLLTVCHTECGWELLWCEYFQCWNAKHSVNRRMFRNTINILLKPKLIFQCQKTVRRTHGIVLAQTFGLKALSVHH